jgi:DNA-binding MarR family transcriptional regulator
VKELFVETARKNGTRRSDVVLFTRQIRERTRLPHHTVKRNLNELVELEYLDVSKGERGARSGYRLVDLPEKKDGLIPGLLRPEDLAELLQRRAAS